MGILGFGKKTTTPAFDSDRFEQSLHSSGYSDEQIATISNEVTGIIDETVTEKATMSYDEFVTSIETRVHGLSTLPSNRITACKEVEEFIKQNPEVSNSIKLYASYIVFGSADIKLEEYRVVLTGEDSDEVAEAQDYIRKWELRSKIKRKMFMLAKDIVPYGDAFLEKIYTQGKLSGVSYIPAKTMLPKLSSLGHPIEYYQLIDQSIHFADENAITSMELAEGKVIKFEPKEVLHFNDGSIVGVTDTPLYNLIVLWKFMKMLEEALLIHKMTRARRFIVFFLDVTDKTKREVRSSVSGFTNAIKRIFRMDLKKGELLSDKSTIPSSSDLVIPVTKDSATKVQNVPSDPSATRIDDLKFYLNRLTTNLLTSYIFNNDIKTGKEEVIERAFMRLVRIYQRQMEYGVEDFYRELLDQEDYINVDIQVIFPAPDSKQEIKVVDSIVRRMMIVNQLTATLQVSPPVKWVVNYVFKDLTQFEVKELVELLEDELENQEDDTDEEEFSSVFEEGEEDEQGEAAQESASHTSNIDDALVSLMSNMKKPRVSEGTKKRKPPSYDDVIKMGLDYLKAQKD